MHQEVCVLKKGTQLSKTEHTESAADIEQYLKNVMEIPLLMQCQIVILQYNS